MNWYLYHYIYSLPFKRPTISQFASIQSNFKIISKNEKYKSKSNIIYSLCSAMVYRVQYDFNGDSVLENIWLALKVYYVLTKVSNLQIDRYSISLRS